MRAQSGKPASDPRVRQTRAAIVGSFNDMVLAFPFEKIQVADVAIRAGVGRSTFYEHFRNIDDLLAHAAGSILGPLADAVGPEDARPLICHVIEHFGVNVVRARAMLKGPGGEAMSRALAQLIAARLERRVVGAQAPALPVSLAAGLIAGAQLGLIREWLHEPRACKGSAVAESIWRSTGALVRAMGMEWRESGVPHT